MATAASNVHSATIATVGVYDPTTNANTVDFNAPYSASTGAASAANVTTADTGTSSGLFDTAIVAAFAAGMGGVMDAKNLNGEAPTNAVYTNIFVTDYGSGKSVTFTNTTGSPVAFNNNSDRTQSAVAFISIECRRSVGERLRLYRRRALSAALAAKKSCRSVSRSCHARAAVRPASNSAPVTDTATFSDGSTASAARDVSGAGDTFYGFTAPAGTYLSSFALDVPGTANYGGVDDIGFITAVVPEPVSITVRSVGGFRGRSSPRGGPIIPIL